MSSDLTTSPISSGRCEFAQPLRCDDRVSATKRDGGGGGGTWPSKHVATSSNVSGPLKTSFTTAGAISKEASTTLAQNKSAKQPDSKLVVLGSSGVGKSALVVRFITKRFIWEYANLECSYRHCGIVDDEPVCIEILDSVGQLDIQERDHGNGVRWGDGFLLVYSITDRDSFDEISRIASSTAATMHSLASNNSTMSFVLVGNKSDLSHDRRVTYAEGEQLATELGCSAFFECSACEGHRHLYDAFYELHRDVVRRRSISSSSLSSQLNRRRRSSAHQVIQVFNKMFTKING